MSQFSWGLSQQNWKTRAIIDHKFTKKHEKKNENIHLKFPSWGSQKRNRTQKNQKVSVKNCIIASCPQSVSKKAVQLSFACRSTINRTLS